MDDSDDVRELILMVLKKEFDTLEAANGLEAVDRYVEQQPDLILMDVEMPVMNGYEACKRIKSINGNTFIPIIFITSKADLDSKTLGLQSGAEDYLTKPFEPEELLARVRATLRTKKLYAQLMDAYSIIDKERDIIAGIQRGFLCDRPPEFPGFKFFADYQPSSKAGGDYYDYINIDDDHLGLLVSDVSGHGTPAAVIMAMMRVILRSFLSHIHSPGETLDRVNKALCENIKSGYFITTFYGVIHKPTRRMRYASAGHNPPILIDYDSGTVRKLFTEKGFPLAISPNNYIEEREVQLVPNSKLALYTDGLTEARNPEGEMFGEWRLEKNLLSFGKTLDASGLGVKIKEVVSEFMRGVNFVDDYTLLVVEALSDRK